MTLDEAKEKIQAGKKYKHFKGGIYTVDFIAYDTETQRQVVAYHDEFGIYFTRPADMWLEPVTISVPRFKSLEEE